MKSGFETLRENYSEKAVILLKNLKAVNYKKVLQDMKALPQTIQLNKCDPTFSKAFSF